MTSRTHTPEDVKKIMEPWRDSASDYERGFIDGMQKQMQSSVDKAVNAIKEALAQPEQECFLVATIGNWGRVEWADGVFPSLGDKMYSAPRTWVGLTDEELADCMDMSIQKTCRAIEAKLKEKNT